MDAIHNDRPVALALLLAAALLVCLGAVALVAAAPASAGPTADPPGSTAGLDALLALQQAQLTAADGAANAQFGYSVAISGDTAAVGVPNDDVGGNTDQGSAYVFVRNGTTWSQQQKLTAGDGAANDNFGFSVAISGDTVVVGAHFDDVGANTNQGSAYVFVRSGTTWSQQQKLLAVPVGANCEFGYSVALSGETAVVGTPGSLVSAHTNQGSAFVFVRISGLWLQQAQLTADDGAANDLLGRSVAIDGDTAVVGADRADVGANTDQGSAYVFLRNGSTWIFQRKLTAADGAAWDNLGCSVAISGDIAVLGACGGEVGANTDQGSAYVFTRSGITWTEQQKLTAIDGAAYDDFGISVAISGDTAVVSADCDSVGANAGQGSAYVFARSGSTWSQQAKLTAADGATDDEFGYSVSTSSTTAVVGAAFNDVGAVADQGSAYVFVVGTPGRPTAKAPKGLISSRTPTFKWTAAAGAATYEVRVYKGSTLLKKKTGITKTSWRCTKRLPRMVWLTWKVRASNAAGAGPWSAKPRFKVR